MRPRFQWDIGRRSLALGERTLVMGVLNVTPDSFSDGGRYFDPQSAIAHGLSLLDEGADILDIGGESTRPGVPTLSLASASKAPNGEVAAPEIDGPLLAGAVSAEEELERVLPVIRAIKQQRPDAILSIDTYKAKVARLAYDAGAEIINDVSGFTWDPAMARTVAERPCGSIVMHVRGLPHQWRALAAAHDVVTLVREELRARVDNALENGIPCNSIVLDPGFGFGKNFDENYPLLARFADFQSLGCPLLAAVSRKSFLGRTVSQRISQLVGADAPDGTLQMPAPPPPAARDTATLAASVAAALAGAHIVRVHSVRPAVEALAIADAVLAAK